MDSFIKKSVGGIVFLFVVPALLLFLPAWTFCYWEAWLYLALFLGSAGSITLYLIKTDTALLQRRISIGPQAEKERSQKIIVFFTQLSFMAMYVVSAFDHRLDWSFVTLPVVIVGEALVIAGFYIIFRVFKENTFTSATVEVAKGQKVISTGPYRVVRHPMYSGGLLMLVSTPLALGSFWGLITFIPITFVIVLRLLDEERFLSANLSGYTAYCNKVQFGLIPRVF